MREHHQTRIIYTFLKYSTFHTLLTWRQQKKSLLLKVHSLEMAIRECNTVNAIQALNKHVQPAIAMLEALKDSDNLSLSLTKHFLLKRSRQMQTVKGKQHSFLQKKKTTLSKPSRQDSNLCKPKIAKEILYFVVFVLKRMTAITPMLKSAGFSVISVLCGFIYHAHYQNLHTHLWIIHVTSVTRKHLWTLISYYNKD